MFGRNIKCLAAALLVILASPALSFAGGSFGIPGADPVTVTQCAKGAAYTYPAYIIYTSKSPDFEGQDIYIYRPRGPVSDP